MEVFNAGEIFGFALGIFIVLYMILKLTGREKSRGYSTFAGISDLILAFVVSAVVETADDRFKEIAQDPKVMVLSTDHASRSIEILEAEFPDLFYPMATEIIPDAVDIAEIEALQTCRNAIADADAAALILSREFDAFCLPRPRRTTRRSWGRSAARG